LNPNRDFKKAKELEEMAAWLIANATGAVISLMPKETCEFDYLFSKPVNGSHYVTCIAEYRGREETTRYQYETVPINVSKVKKIRQAAEIMGIRKMIYIVRWMDTEPMWFSLNQDLGEPGMFTRRHQERGNDRPELVYFIPTDKFRPFS
jgi:hypothetical protein